MIEKFRNMNPKAKAWAVRGVIALIVLIIGYPLYRNATRDVHRKRVKSEYKVLEDDSSTFEKGLYTKTKQEIEGIKSEVKELKELFEKDQKGRESAPITDQIPAGPLQPGEQDMQKLKQSVEKRLLESRSPDKTDVAKQQIFQSSALPQSNKIAEAMEKQTKAGIKTIQGTASGKKNEKPGIYLPPSFMDASLLTGVIASTTQAGQNNTVPMLIRIKDLAVLPNEVKEDLKGCFVIAEGSGDLSQERIKARLLNLSCITKKGDSLIDQPVKGWVVDADGRAGLGGRVVAKFGSHMARVAVAGFLEGFGKALDLSVTNTEQNYFGQRTTTLENTDADTIMKAGVGRSIVNVAEDLQKFYLQLAQQTLPVIEVGPKQEITLVISEGASLEIKERKQYAKN
jgi:conjugal transfer pilus assembly protein TraB